MTKKHFEAIANILYHEHMVLDLSQAKFINATIDCIIYKLGQYFETQNPRFNVEKFHTKAGWTKFKIQ